MAYIALYRKYRSQSFDELQGQDAVTTTLRNALDTGRFSHAYLFYGARGCGKTSTARLLARALNCVAQDGPTGSPCGVCRMCVSIREGTCMDVTEMDAASETGIDDVREKIIENVQYAPAEARYKVYIIDEVHDLSAKAFDALLKTLEEPPPHVVFVLATTEYHKVPITIRSRCQGFQFKRGTLHDLGASVERVVASEGFTADPEAVQAIARAAEGSWRDALSILEQVLAYSDGHVTAQTVHRAVGTVGTETLARVTQTLADGQWDTTLTIAAELMDSGTDVRQLLTAMEGHLRDLMLLAAGAKQAAAHELGVDRIALLQPQTHLFTPSILLAMMGELSAAQREIRTSNHHRWILERALLRLLTIGQGMSAEAQPAPTKVHSTVPRATEPPARSPSLPVLAATPTVVPRPPVPAPTPVNAYTEPVQDHEDRFDGGAEDETEGIEPEREEDFDEAVAPESEPGAAGFTPLVRPIHRPAEAPAIPASTEQTAVTSPVTDASDPRFADEVTLEVVRRAWPRVLKLIEKAAPAGISWLMKAEVTELNGKTVSLSFHDSFARDRINRPKGREMIEQKLNEALRTAGYKVLCLLSGEVDTGGVTVGKSSPSNPSDTGYTAALEMPTLLDTPALDAPVDSFSGSIMDFEVPPANAAQNSTLVGSQSTSALEEQSLRLAPSQVPSEIPILPGAGTVERDIKSSPKPELIEPELDESNGMLSDTLSIFGGEVVRTEKI